MRCKCFSSAPAKPVTLFLSLIDSLHNNGSLDLPLACAPKLKPIM